MADFLADSLVDAWIDLDEIYRHLKKELEEPLAKAKEIKKNHDKVLKSLRVEKSRWKDRNDQSMGAKIQMIKNVQQKNNVAPNNCRDIKEEFFQ